jgi:hypothetical protein
MRQKYQASSFPFPSIVYLKHTNLGDILKVILFAAESPLGLVPMLYHIKYNNKDVIFTVSGALNTIVRYQELDKEPSKKWIQLKRITGEYSFVDKIGDDAKSLYIPILELEKGSFNFPL